MSNTTSPNLDFRLPASTSLARTPSQPDTPLESIRSKSQENLIACQDSPSGYFAPDTPPSSSSAAAVAGNDTGDIPPNRAVYDFPLTDSTAPEFDLELLSASAPPSPSPSPSPPSTASPDTSTTPNSTPLNIDIEERVDTPPPPAATQLEILTKFTADTNSHLDELLRQTHKLNRTRTEILTQILASLGFADDNLDQAKELLMLGPEQYLEQVSRAVRGFGEIGGRPQWGGLVGAKMAVTEMLEIVRKHVHGEEDDGEALDRIVNGVEDERLPACWMWWLLVSES